jgi:NADPH2:quinone reductase
MKDLCFDTFGGSDVLYYGDVPEPICGESDILLRTKAIGLNFATTYRRQWNHR